MPTLSPRTLAQPEGSRACATVASQALSLCHNLTLSCILPPASEVKRNNSHEKISSRDFQAVAELSEAAAGSASPSGEVVHPQRFAPCVAGLLQRLEADPMCGGACRSVTQPTPETMPGLEAQQP